MLASYYLHCPEPSNIIKEEKILTQFGAGWESCLFPWIKFSYKIKGDNGFRYYFFSFYSPKTTPVCLKTNTQNSLITYSCKDIMNLTVPFLSLCWKYRTILFQLYFRKFSMTVFQKIVIFKNVSEERFTKNAKCRLSFPK